MPPVACCSSHSRTYRSLVPVAAASSAAVAEPCVPERPVEAEARAEIDRVDVEEAEHRAEQALGERVAPLVGVAHRQPATMPVAYMTAMPVRKPPST